MRALSFWRLNGARLLTTFAIGVAGTSAACGDGTVGLLFPGPSVDADTQDRLESSDVRSDAPREGSAPDVDLDDADAGWGDREDDRASDAGDASDESHPPADDASDAPPADDASDASRPPSDDAGDASSESIDDAGDAPEESVEDARTDVADATDLERAIDSPADAPHPDTGADAPNPDGSPADASGDQGEAGPICGDGNPCTLDLADADGGCAHPPAPITTPCSGPQGGRCNGSGTCVATFMVVRVGDGTFPLTPASSAVFIERRLFDSSAAIVGSAAPLPKIASGANWPLTLSGDSSREGELSLSSDGRFVTLAGYAAPPGSLNIANSFSIVWTRVVGRVDGAHAVDTSTRLDTAFSAGSVRGAASIDGSAFWVSGDGDGAGIYRAERGVNAVVPILAVPDETNAVHIFGGQLYATSETSSFANVFAVGSGVPATAQPATPLAGMPVAGPRPFSFALFDRDAGVAGLDTAYVADQRSAGGGVQKWTFNGTRWNLVAVFNQGLGGTSGLRGLAGSATNSTVTLIATSTGDSPNRILMYVDNGIDTNPAAVVLATAATNTAYRGVALAP